MNTEAGREARLPPELELKPRLQDRLKAKKARKPLLKTAFAA